MGAIFLDQALSDGLEGGPPPQLADGVHEVRVEGQSQASAATKTVALLHRQAVDLPSTELPGNTAASDNNTETFAHWVLGGAHSSGRLFNKLHRK